MARSRSCGRCSARSMPRAVAVDDLADLDPPRADHAAAAETAEVGDETVLLRPAQRMLAVGLDRMAAGRWQPRWPSPAASMTTPAIWPGCGRRRARHRGVGVVGDAGRRSPNAGFRQCRCPTTESSTPVDCAAIESAFETNLRALGTRTINSAPSHPQTCGKIERFWQTLKKWLRARPAPATLAELNDSARPSSATSTTTTGRTERCAEPPRPRRSRATEPARPADRPLPAPVFVTRHTVGREVRQPVRPALQGQRRPALGRPRTATSSATATTSPSSAAPPWSANSPPTPPATTSPATKPPEPTAPANPNRHHKCQRCPET